MLVRPEKWELWKWSGGKSPGSRAAWSLFYTWIMAATAPIVSLDLRKRALNSIEARKFLCLKATGRNEFTGTTDFQSVAWDYSTDWKSVIQIADGKFYPAGRLSALAEVFACHSFSRNTMQQTRFL